VEWIMGLEYIGDETEFEEAIPEFDTVAESRSYFAAHPKIVNQEIQDHGSWIGRPPLPPCPFDKCNLKGTEHTHPMTAYTSKAENAERNTDLDTVRGIAFTLTLFFVGVVVILLIGLTIHSFTK